MRCGAKLKGGEGHCARPASAGMSRCRLHGGAPGSGRPPIHGRYSELTRVLGAVWEAVNTDTNLKDLSADLALCLARERELLARLEDGDTPDFRTTATAFLAAIRTAGADGDGDGMRAALAGLERHLTDGADRDGAWEEILSLSERKAKLT